MVKEPPRLPRCLAQPDTPGSNGPSSRAISLLTSHSGQRATSIHTAHTAAGQASSVASHSNRRMPCPPKSPSRYGEIEPISKVSRLTRGKTGVRAPWPFRLCPTTPAANAPARAGRQLKGSSTAPQLSWPSLAVTEDTSAEQRRGDHDAPSKLLLPDPGLARQPEPPG